MQRRNFMRLAGAGVTAGALARSLPASPADPAGPPRKARMKVGTQHGSSDEILGLLAAFGVNHVCSALPSARLDEHWSVAGLTKLRERVESFGLTLDMVP